MQLSAQQEEAIKVIVSRLRGEYPEKLTYLAGYAGTGKSTILPHIIEALGFPIDKIKFLAPTGKAAKVMTKKLAAQGFKAVATTIHSAIYRARPAPISQLEAELYEAQTQRERLKMSGGKPEAINALTRTINRLEKELDDLYTEEKIHFQLNPDSIIKDAMLVVIDEASMVGRSIADDLLYFEIPILAMGDPGQLPPVQDEAGLTAGEPDYFLTEVHRQAADNPILQLATLARQGKIMVPGEYGDGRARVIKRRDFNNGHFDWEAEPPQFIVGTNATRWRITKMLRQGYGIAGADLPNSGPQVGEPLIVCKNNRSFPTLINGTEVTAADSHMLIKGQTTFPFKVTDEDGRGYTLPAFQGLFEEHYAGKKNAFSSNSRSAFKARKSSLELDWGWAITCHKSQGSQYDDVVVIDESGVFRDDGHLWLYTAITRAAERLTILV
ncbi:RecD-like DNA helicase [Caulobacter phage C1]|nr:RecD-like DNA helicase [Caulobacter phage C1]UTU08412.1 RecD-like DNA helicase [Caulobacter phage C2]WGN97080.1 RecD-like DNA helicase Atu2026 [Bertelyvirus sp.]WGN97597.1 RecD-like DNA helicase Atu2026 [Bertelyvirus sp.]